MVPRYQFQIDFIIGFTWFQNFGVCVIDPNYTNANLGVQKQNPILGINISQSQKYPQKVSQLW